LTTLALAPVILGAKQRWDRPRGSTGIARWRDAVKKGAMIESFEI